MALIKELVDAAGEHGERSNISLPAEWNLRTSCWHL
jgi:hypothetical protein